MPVSPVEEMLERIARERPDRLNIERSPIPTGDFGSITPAQGVTIRVTGRSPQELGYSYEQGIRDVFGSAKSGSVFVAHIGRFVDDVVDQQVLEAKHVDVYMESIYNPRSDEPWEPPAREKVVQQARVLTQAYEGGAIYFTNDQNFAEDYTNLFEQNGISKFRFVVVPSAKD